jgi:hypothetical protein
MVRVAMLLAEYILSGVLATPMKYVDCKSNVCKEFVVLNHPLKGTVVVKEDMLWLWARAKHILHEILAECVRSIMKKVFCYSLQRC